MNYFLSANLKYTSELDALYKKTKKKAFRLGEVSKELPVSGEHGVP